MRFFAPIEKRFVPVLFFAVGTLVGALSPFATPLDNKLDVILNGHVKAMGDLRAWDLVQSLRISGRFDMTRKDIHFTEWRRRGDLMRIQWRNPRRETELDVGCNREIAWYVAPFDGKGRHETIPIAQARTLSRKAALENPIIREARTAFRNWNRLEDATLNGKECYVLEWSPKNEAKERFFIEKSTYYEKGKKVESALIEETRINPGVGSLFFRPPQNFREQTAPAS